MVPQGGSRGPGFYPSQVHSACRPPTPSSLSLSKVASVQCCDVQVFWVNPPAPLLFLQLNPYLRFSLWGLLREEEEEETDSSSFQGVEAFLKLLSWGWRMPCSAWRVVTGEETVRVPCDGVGWGLHRAPAPVPHPHCRSWSCGGRGRERGVHLSPTASVCPGCQQVRVQLCSPRAGPRGIYSDSATSMWGPEEGRVLPFSKSSSSRSGVPPHSVVCCVLSQPVVSDSV